MASDRRSIAVTLRLSTVNVLSRSVTSSSGIVTGLVYSVQLKRMPLKWNQYERQRRSAPSPPCGEGDRSYGASCIRQLLPPPPTPPHEGEGSTPCVSQQSCIQLNGTRFSVP